MATSTRIRKKKEMQIEFPIRCKTWKEVEEIKRKYLKPVKYGPKGQPIYDHTEVMKYVIFPADSK